MICGRNRSPDKVVIEGFEEDPEALSKKDDQHDFFDETKWAGAGTPPHRLNASLRSSSPALSTNSVHSTQAAKATPLAHEPAEQEESTANSLLADQTKKMLSSSAEGSGSRPSKKGGKLGGVKKVAVNFDEMEAKAKEEASRREALEKQGLLDLEMERKAKEQAIV